MRETEIVFFRLLALALLVTSLGSSCKSEPASKPESQPSASREAEPPKPASEQPAPTEPAAPAPDPQHADKLADLDDLCKALDHDYVDGTLSDYYKGIEPRTEWGKAQRDAGNASIQPGRLLEKAVAELAGAQPGSPGVKPVAENPALEHCRKLLDYLDDVE